MKSALAIGLLLASALLHWPPATSDFSYDDVDFVQRNASIRSLASATRTLLSPFPPNEPERGLYRPLTNLSYAADHALWGLDASGFQRTNVGLYAAVVLLVFALARWHTRSPGAAFAVALLFSVHPVHCEAVDSVAGRSELLALLFALASLLAFLRAVADDGGPRRAPMIAAAGFYAAACLSKETAVVLPAVALIHWAARALEPRGVRAQLRHGARLALPFASVLACYFALRLQALGTFGPKAPVLSVLTPVERLWTAGSVYLEYARLLVFPDVLQPDFHYQQVIGVSVAPTPEAVAGLLLALGLLGAWGVAIVRHWRARASAGSAVDDEADRLRVTAIAGLATSFAFLFPVSHVFAIGALMAERFLFAPSVGFVLVATVFAAAGLQRVSGSDARARALGALLVAVLALAGAARSTARATEWRDGVALWLSAQAAGGVSDYRVHSNLAAHYIQRGMLDDAAASLELALELESNDENVWINLALVESQRGNLEKGIQLNHEMLERFPGNATAWFNLGEMEVRRHEVPRAIGYFEHALALNPNLQPAREQLEAARARQEFARRFLEPRRERARKSREPDFVETVAQACRIVGDRPCAEALDARATELRAQSQSR